MRVFMTGGTGSIGSRLADALVARGDDVVIVSRSVRSGPDGMTFVAGSPSDPAEPGGWGERLAGCDAVIHLAGEPFARRRWGEHEKHRIQDSRVTSTRHLVAALAATPAEKRPRILVCASLVDYYGYDDGDDRVTESRGPGAHFLATVAQEVEGLAAGAARYDLRVASLRCGVVVGADREALVRYTGPHSLLFLGVVGSGEQWLSWVHIDDAVQAYLWALDRPVAGPLNLVAPGDIRQGDFARSLLAARRIAPRSLDEPTIRHHFGDLADHLLQGRRAVPAALVASGFRFRRADAPAAIAAIL